MNGTYLIWLSSADDKVPMLFAACKECNTPVFQWMATTPFTLDQITEAIAKHDVTWHD